MGLLQLRHQILQKPRAPSRGLQPARQSRWTGFEGLAHLRPHEFQRGILPEPTEVLQHIPMLLECAVITSYSIHYTKLYEPRIVARFGIALILLAAVGNEWLAGWLLTSDGSIDDGFSLWA